MAEPCVEFFMKFNILTTDSHEGGLGTSLTPFSIPSLLVLRALPGTRITTVFGRIDLRQYLDRLTDEGFERIHSRRSIF